MRFVNRAGIPRSLGAALFGLLLCGPLFAQYGNQPTDDDIRQTVARVSYLNGGVSYARGDDPDNWQPADLNVPMTLGDRIYTGRGGRAELAIQGGAYVRLDGDSDLEALNLTDDTQQLSLKVGTASFQVRRLGPDDIFEVDTPNAAITLDGVGDYRVDVDQDGNSRIMVRRGRALVAAGGGQVTVQSGDEMDIRGLDDPRYDVVGLGPQDGFDRWVSVRGTRVTRARSSQYVSQDIVGVADLDDSGTWQDVPEYGRAWAPSRVAVDWAPYRDGHWVWQDPWGWTWVSTESWGWAPYHYGRWVTSSSRWYWVPDAPRTTVRYSPALVGFVGGGPGVTVAAGGFVGWFPLAPRDPFVPWWGARARGPVVEARNVTYVNRSYVTVVRHDTFVSGGFVGRAVIRDQAVVRTVIAAPVVRGPIQIVPTTASLRLAVRPGLPAAPRPSAAIIQRPVVARIAPPPAPPVFAAKVDVIRQNQGAPVAPLAAAKIVEQKGPSTQSVSRIKPVVSEQGRMTLAPAAPSGRPERARAAAPAAAPQPVSAAPIRGREVATVAKPVAAVPPGGDVKRVERGREAVPAGQPVQPGQPAVQPVQPVQPVDVQKQQQQDQRRLELEKQQQQKLQQEKQQQLQLENQQQLKLQQEKQQQQQQQQQLEKQQQLKLQQEKQQQQQQQLEKQQQLKLQQDKQQQQQQQQQLEKQQQLKLQQEKQQQQQQQLEKQQQQKLQQEKQLQQQQQQQQEQLRLEQEKRQRATAQQAQPPAQSDQQKRQEVERQKQQQQPQPQEHVQAPPEKQAPPDAKKQPEKKETPKKDDKKKDDKKDEKKDDNKPQ
jgi:hypothetical protein